jgi:AcrR family transcriptional regulator
MTAIEPGLTGEEREPGLRERKKVRTRETIARVALRLFGEHGFQETTIKQIADAADVSPRTVSAYFPMKEELVFSDSDAAFDSLSALLLSGRPPGQTVADALREWIRAFIDVDADHLERRRCLRELIESDPALRTFERGIQERAERIIATAVAVDLELKPDDLLPRMVGAATLAALDSLGRDKKESHQKPTAEGLALLDDAMAFIGGGVSALAVRRGLAS